MSFALENKVPVPKRVKTGGRKQKYPWAKMRVGQSFFVPAGEGSQNGLTSCARAVGLSIKTRSVDGGFRVWRIA